MRSKLLMNKYNYIFIIINILFIIINNYYYLPDNKLNQPVRLASVSTIDTRDGLLTNSSIDDTKVVQLWLSELEYRKSKEGDFCNFLMEGNRASIDITGNKNVANFINISIISNRPDYIYECYFEIIKRIDEFQSKIFKERIKNLNKINYNYIPVQSLLNNSDIKIRKDNIYKKNINIILSLVIALQIIFIIKRMSK